MDVESITKIATASVAGVGGLVGFFQYLTSRRSQNYQTYKTELELLGQSIVGAEGDPGFKQFLVNVRKEKLSFVAFGMPIPNSELERVMTYYGKGKATTQEIAKAWPYRNRTKTELSFELSRPFKWTLWMVRFYVGFCLLLILALFVTAVVFGSSLRDFAMIGIVVVALVLIVALVVRTNEGLLTAVRLAKREKDSEAA